METTILILEDEIIIAYDIKGILESEGFNVEVVVDFENSLDIIKASNPSLVLLDINLKSNLDGIEIAERLLEKDNIPFIYITSYYDKVTLERVKNTRPYGFITKPFKNVDIISTVSIVLNNFNHRKIDPVREDKEILNDIPFFLKSSINYINENIYDKIEVETLAMMSKWKYHHYIRIFNNYMGQTPYQYILQRKIEVAKALLAETDLTMTQIAFNLSFESYGNFSNAFKKNVGISPKSYRDKYYVIKKLK